MHGDVQQCKFIPDDELHVCVPGKWYNKDAVSPRR